MEAIYESLLNEKEFTSELSNALDDVNEREYIEIFLTTVLTKISEKTVKQEWNISNFKIIVEKAHQLDVHLNDIKLENGLDGATLLFHFQVDNAIEFIKLKPYVKYTSSEMDRLGHLNDDIFITFVKAFLELKVPIESNPFANDTIQTLVRLNEIALVREFIEYVKSNIQRYLTEEIAILLPLEIFEYCRTHDALKLSKHHEILASDDLSKIIYLLQKPVDCNLQYLNPINSFSFLAF